MTLKILIDVNLTPEWEDVLRTAGWQAVHWTRIGSRSASDREIMDWAVINGFSVFTHDLDFGATLALTRATGPSVIQIRGQQTLPEDIEGIVVNAIRKYEQQLIAGALVVVEHCRSRVRILPFN